MEKTNKKKKMPGIKVHLPTISVLVCRGKSSPPSVPEPCPGTQAAVFTLGTRMSHTDCLSEVDLF